VAFYTELKPEANDDRLTRGGPVVQSPSFYGIDLSAGSDPRKPLVMSASTSYAHDELGGSTRVGALTLSGRPTETIRFSVQPQLVMDRTEGQYIAAPADPTATATFGRRYVLSTLKQTTVAVGTRLDWTFTPTLSLQLYAQPFVSAAEFSNYRELAEPRTLRTNVYGRDVGTIEEFAPNRFRVDPDAAGPARSFTFGQAFGQSDFNLRSLRGNAVLRWEWRPGSTLFFVWQQEREGLDFFGDFDGGREFRGIFDAPSSNVFLIKATYWLAP
jgi:hypothetical protein